MKARKRYLLLFVAFLGLIHFGLIYLRNKWISSKQNELINNNLVKFNKKLIIETTINETKSNSNFYSFREFNQNWFKQKHNDLTVDQRSCRMNTCFDFSRCFNPNRGTNNRLTIHLYPNPDELSNHISESYFKILSFIKNSNFYETDPQKACLFVTTFDTLDRDPLSPDYQKFLPTNELLFEGKNHLMFNLYSGSWPSYQEMDFSGLTPSYYQNSILIKASQSYDNYRPGFDVSFPLFAKNHPQKGPQFVSHESQLNYVPTISETNSQEMSETNKNLLVFKGKRYIYGIGSETRNSLYHLNNNKDILIYTTCKHGKKWKDFDKKDDKCEKDNQLYDKYDYKELMSNSTFCLVPRGRRLGSFRFLEALSLGCIPVVLSNSWVLPFHEVIDWSSAVIRSDERLLLQIPEQLRSLSPQKVFEMRAKCLSIYSQYFSSVDTIVATALQIISERIQIHLSRDRFLWNLLNPSIHFSYFNSQFSQQLTDFPGYRSQTTNSTLNDGFTAIILISKPISSQTIIKLLTKTLYLSQYLRKILIIWSLSSVIPQYLLNMKTSSNSMVYIIEPKTKSPSSKLYSYSMIKTDAIFQLDPETTLTTEELDFAFMVWKSFSHRVIGFTARDHHFDDQKDQFTYTSKWTNQYSLVLLDAAIYHKYYNYVFTHDFISSVSSSISSLEFDNECVDLSFAFLVSHITREGPIKITQRKKTTNSQTMNAWSVWNTRRNCFQQLIQFYGYLPLIKSKLRLDPVLYKDNVSNLRKKYRKLESVS